ncbi:pyridoxal phosphate-dependent decarboxylase family protein [Gloeobacter violaceus]|nr:aspartate aminotransferase family protein [Gloeobacter violaceus]
MQPPELQAPLQTQESRCPQPPFEHLFLSGAEAGTAAYRQAVSTATDILVRFALQPQPYRGASPQELAAVLAGDPCPEAGLPTREVLERVEELVVQHSVKVTHPDCIAHLHCPPLIPALAAEMVVSATNQSLDSWDQSPAATIVEQQIVQWLCRLYFAQAGDGTFTSGGTQSNFMGLLLARDHYALTHLDWNCEERGLPPGAERLRILCSQAAHFTVQKSAGLLGLGRASVVPVGPDSDYRLRGVAVERAIADLRRDGLSPIALVATAGTTDLGSIDAMAELAIVARTHGLWLHADAAVGGALALSEHHRGLLAGIEAADSITVDFHKLFYQPISCGAFLVRNRRAFEVLRLHADCLNPEGTEEAGIPDLVIKSVLTTRRFDALKLYICLQALGRREFARLVESTMELARATATIIEHDPELELACYPAINAVVFRYAPEGLSAFELDSINKTVQATLLRRGRAVVARTRLKDRVQLKFTLLNPLTTVDHIRGLLQEIKAIGRAEAARGVAADPASTVSCLAPNSPMLNL